MKKTRLTLSIDRGLLKLAKKAAKDNGRSLSSMVARWIEEKTALTKS